MNVYITGPDTDPTLTDPVDAAADAAASEAAEPTTEEALVAAMDEGIAAATPDAAEPAAVDFEPKAESKEAEPEKAAPDADTEAEITGLGLKEKAAARFRELTAEVKELAPIRAQLEAAGIKDVAELPVLVRHAKDGADMVRMVTDTGAQPEQFSMTLDYLTVASKANAGDMVAAQQAYELSMGEAAAWAKVLGKEVAGVHDPLAEHPDLRQEVEDGDITKARALELAAVRTQQAAVAAARSQQDTASSQQREQEEAVTQGKASLQAFDAQMLASDPSYASKRGALNQMVVFIRQSLPPSQWAEATQRAYATIPDMTPVAAPQVKPPIGPVRPSGPRPALAPQVFDDPMAALDFGVTAASG